MLQQLPAVAFAPWIPSNKGAAVAPLEFHTSQLLAPKSSFRALKFGHLYNRANATRRPETFPCAYGGPIHGHNKKKRDTIPQNEELPPTLPKKKKKPYPIPLKKIQQAARADKKLAEMGIEKHLEPPKNGILGLSADGEDLVNLHHPIPGYKWRLTIAYDGTRFSGWQYQKSIPTVQCIVEQALTRVTKLEREDLQLVGAGRTDAGVHAYGQVAHFVTPFKYDSLEGVHKAINGLLPPDIRIREIGSVVPEFHARFSVTSKIYVYRIYNDAVMDPFHRHYAYHSAHKLNAAAMSAASKYFVGNHDYSAFANVSRNDRVPNPLKNIIRFDVNEMGPLLQLEVEGSGFLYRQVRNMVALLLQVGREALPPEIVPKILASRDREELAKFTFYVPPHGLSLFAIKYNEDHLQTPSDCPVTSLGMHYTITKCKLPYY